MFALTHLKAERGPWSRQHRDSSVTARCGAHAQMLPRCVPGRIQSCPQMCHRCASGCTPRAPRCATCAPAVPLASQLCPRPPLIHSSCSASPRASCASSCAQMLQRCATTAPAAPPAPACSRDGGRSHPIPLRNPHQSCWCCKSEGGTTPELQHSAPHLPLVTLTEASLPLGNGHLTSSCCLLFFIQK